LSYIGLRYCSTGGIVNRGIQVVTWSPNAHVEFLQDADWIELIRRSIAAGAPNAEALRKGLLKLGVNDFGTLGARHADGVQIRQTAYDKFTRDDRYTVELPWENKLRVMQFALDQVGKGYDTSAVAGILIHRDWREEDSWFCSELVVRAFEVGGFPMLNVGEHINRITPRDANLSPIQKPVVQVAQKVAA
jgi:hypothetical protein